MLVLTRKPGEVINIGPNIKITTIRIGPNSVRLGIDAPQHLNVVRAELLNNDFKSEYCNELPDHEDSLGDG